MERRAAVADDGDGDANDGNLVYRLAAMEGAGTRIMERRLADGTRNGYRQKLKYLAETLRTQLGYAEYTEGIKYRRSDLNKL